MISTYYGVMPPGLPASLGIRLPDCRLPADLAGWLAGCLSSMLGGQVRPQPRVGDDPPHRDAQRASRLRRQGTVLPVPTPACLHIRPFTRPVPPVSALPLAFFFSVATVGAGPKLKFSVQSRPDAFLTSRVAVAGRGAAPLSFSMTSPFVHVLRGVMVPALFLPCTSNEEVQPRAVLSTRCQPLPRDGSPTPCRAVGPMLTGVSFISR